MPVESPLSYVVLLILFIVAAIFLFRACVNAKDNNDDGDDWWEK